MPCPFILRSPYLYLYIKHLWWYCMKWLVTAMTVLYKECWFYNVLLVVVFCVRKLNLLDIVVNILWIFFFRTYELLYTYPYCYIISYLLIQRFVLLSCMVYCAIKKREGVETGKLICNEWAFSKLYTLRNKIFWRRMVFKMNC